MRTSVLIAASAAGAAAWLRAAGGAGGAMLRRRLGVARRPEGQAVPRPRPPVGFRRSRDTGRDEAPVVELCTALAAELRAGRPANEALIRAAGEGGHLVRRAVAAARTGGDVAAALRADAADSGVASLRRLVACWRVALDSGAGLAAAADRLAEVLRRDRAQRAEVAAQLAGARASARLMAGLPVVGLVLGAGLGARPADVLLGTPSGLGCLGAGLLLDASGLAWMHRLAAAAERGR